MPRVEVVEYSAQRPALPGDPVGDALVLPGRGYGIDHPLLSWTLRMLHEQGWWCTTVRWSVDDVEPAAATPFVEGVAADLYARRRAAGTTLVVAKSLGTLAAGWAARHALPGVWLTPLLGRPEVAQSLAGYPAPALLVGGTRDRFWDPDVAARSAVDVLELPEADHSLLLPGPWEESHDLERTVLAVVAAFAERVLRPDA
ncbi:hypothetical protein FE251_06730 [Georgenia wutianyii]|uniref:Alpha/beta hydrolase n=1 Tax=Georgenia wutianyii TaxID=2585135 RepID=A0ABX5VLM2_9MICO|nr:hypothetical protein [Georgenia wutianyii]QDB79098.1 hypothetical protein FE251_06730 [Georgenia wutianyii]